MTALHDFSLTDPAVQKCPFPYYEKMRSEAPVHKDPATGFYIVAKDSLIREAGANFEVFSAQVDQRRARANNVSAEVDRIYAESGWPKVSTIIYQDPPVHTRFRKLVDRVFTPARLRQMEEYLIALVEDLIAQFKHRGECDFLREFAIPLPIYVIADALGVPREDLERFKAWSDATVEPLGLLITPEREIECAHLVVEFQHYFAAVAEARRAEPKNDLVSDLVHAQVGGEQPLSTPELLSIIQQLLIAGNETTTNALASAMLVLIRTPGLADAMRGDIPRIKTFVEEVLRLESPIQGLFRKTTCDTTLGGIPIPKDSIVCLRYGSGNRDGDVWDKPDDIDLERKSAARHLAFSSGNHYCVGAQLARGEMLWAINSLLNNLDNMRLPDGFEPRYQPSVVFRALEALPLRFDARTPE